MAALGANPDRLLRDFKFLGLLFESMVVRDLRVYGQAADAEVFHYREDGRLEVDAVVQAHDGRWAAFEVKLGPKRVEEGARNLLRLAERVDQRVVGPPMALGVIVASGYGYTRPDGVGVIPIGGTRAVGGENSAGYLPPSPCHGYPPAISTPYASNNNSTSPCHDLQAVVRPYADLVLCAITRSSAGKTLIHCPPAPLPV